LAEGAGFELAWETGPLRKCLPALPATTSKREAEQGSEAART
jgi:hypothetical protein